MIRASFARQLTRSDKTKQAVGQRYGLETDLVCFGICEKMQSPIVSKAIDVTSSFEPVSPDGSRRGKEVKITVTFGELEDAADALLSGYPEICDLHTRFYRDDDDRFWVYFAKLGVHVLAEGRVTKTVSQALTKS